MTNSIHRLAIVCAPRLGVSSAASHSQPRRHSGGRAKSTKDRKEDFRVRKSHSLRLVWRHQNLAHRNAVYTARQMRQETVINVKTLLRLRQFTGLTTGHLTFLVIAKPACAEPVHSLRDSIAHRTCTASIYKRSELDFFGSKNIILCYDCSLPS
jgi:hypothetical protein